MLTVDPRLRRRDLRPSASVSDFVVKETLKIMTGTHTYGHYAYKTTQKRKYQISVAKCQGVLLITHPISPSLILPLTFQ